MFFAAAPRDPSGHSSWSGDSNGHDQELISRVRASDPSALEEIFRSHWRGLLHFAQSLTKSRSSAEEIVQDLFLALWVGRERWIITTSLRAYLFQSVRNRASKHLRDSRLERESEVNVPDSVINAITTPFNSSADIANDMDAEALRAVVRAATEALPERARQVFVLSRQQHLSYEQIAVVLGISVKTVEMHMTRALSDLRERLKGWKG